MKCLEGCKDYYMLDIAYCHKYGLAIFLAILKCDEFWEEKDDH